MWTRKGTQKKQKYRQRKYRREIHRKESIDKYICKRVQKGLY